MFTRKPTFSGRGRRWACGLGRGRVLIVLLLCAASAALFAARYSPEVSYVLLVQSQQPLDQQQQHHQQDLREHGKEHGQGQQQEQQEPQKKQLQEQQKQLQGNRTQDQALSNSGLKDGRETPKSERGGLRDGEPARGAGTHGLPAADEERTLAFREKTFISGFRNNGMVFAWFVMEAVMYNFTSLLLDNLNWYDLAGKWNQTEPSSVPWRSKFCPHALLFDVEHWNSYYPLLPRLIPYNASIHHQYNPATRGPTPGATFENATKPYYNGTVMRGWNQYRMYTRAILENPDQNSRSPVDLAILRGALRPSPSLQRHANSLTRATAYAALHARIEPDMQVHPVCLDKKVLLLSEILRSLEAYFPRPDFDLLFVCTNRPMLEEEVRNNSSNLIAVDNLRELNRIRDHGLWNGTVKVFEAGSSYMRTVNESEDELGRYVGISGAVLDYFLAVEASIFIGTEVSTFTTDLVQSRFFRSNRQNYHYTPNGVQHVTPDNATEPPRFVC